MGRATRRRGKLHRCGDRDLTECSSGRELAEGGFAEDVAIATELDATDVVPLLVDGVFIDGRHR